MVDVSASYNPYRASRHVEIETDLRIVDEEAAGNASASLNGYHECSAVDTFLTDERTGFGGAFFTLEENYLACDRMFDIMPDDYHAGIWGSKVGYYDSDLGEIVSPYMDIEISFSQPVTSLGITLFFDPDAGVYPAHVACQLFNSSTSTMASDSEDSPDVPPIYTESLDIDRAFVALMFDGGEALTYTSLKLTISARGYNRVRLSGIVFGIIEHYNNARIKSWDWRSEADVELRSIPSASQIVSVLDDNGQYRLTDPALISCIHPGVSMRTRVIVDGEAIQMHDTVVTSIKNNGDGLTATIESSDAVLAFDSVGMRSSSSSSDPMWVDANAFTSKLMARGSGLFGASETGYPFSMPANRRLIRFQAHRDNQTIRTWIPYIAQAIRCHVRLDRDGTLSFIDVATAADAESPVAVDAITKSNSTKITFEAGERTNRIDIATALTNDDGEEISAYAEISNPYPRETLQQETISNLLLTHTIDTYVAEWMLRQYNRRITYTAEWRGNPALDLLDVITIDGNPGIITRLDYSFDGYFRGTVTAACSLNEIMDGVNIRKGETETWNP